MGRWQRLGLISSVPFNVPLCLSLTVCGTHGQKAKNKKQKHAVLNEFASDFLKKLNRSHIGRWIYNCTSTLLHFCVIFEQMFSIWSTFFILHPPFFSTEMYTFGEKTWFHILTSFPRKEVHLWSFELLSSRHSTIPLPAAVPLFPNCGLKTWLFHSPFLSVWDAGNLTSLGQAWSIS